MKTNRPKVYTATTYEGGRADPHLGGLRQLERQVSTCLLFDNTFYAKGATIADEIAATVAGCVKNGEAQGVKDLAVRARTELKLRHVPLWLALQLVEQRESVSDLLPKIILRPDEMSEFLALYWKAKRRPLPASVKRGLAATFPRFSEYQLAKWNRDGVVKLRDVLFLCHAKPRDEYQASVWKSLVNGTIAPADTWEVALSAGTDKPETWTRLLTEKKLGYMALLMNLRNMAAAGVDTTLVGNSLVRGAPKSWALPFRFISAMKAAPMYTGYLDTAMVLALENSAQIPGSTAIIVDVSGSMVCAPISQKSTLDRLDAASALAILARSRFPGCRVFTFSDELLEVPPYQGLGLWEALRKVRNGGTYLSNCLKHLPKVAWERILVITDEQAHDGILPTLAPHQYIMNVAPYSPGLDTSGGWKRINGWSERVIDWVLYEEGLNVENTPSEDPDVDPGSE